MTVTINGTTGYSGPVGTIGDLTTTGNTTLGDASSDTLTLNGNTASIPNGLNFTNGNIGIGVTPSAWSGVGSVLQVGTSAAIIGNSVNSSSFISNAYYDGSNYKYIGTGYAARLALTSGAYAFQTAPSGTAGAAITFTQAMTLDAIGNLGVGITSIPNYNSNLRTVSFNNTSGVVHDYCVNGTRTGSFICQSTGFDLSTLTAIPLVFSTNATERMRLDSSGNLGLRVTPSAWHSTTPTFQIGAFGLLTASTSSNYCNIGTNYYFNGSNNLYIGTGRSTLYSQNDGAHAWLIAGSGTAGNTVSFTTAMTLDTNGTLSTVSSSSNAANFQYSGAWTSGNANFVTMYMPNMSGGTAGLALGRAGGTYNTSKIIFGYAGSNSTSNYLGLGFWDADSRLTIYPTGNATLTGSLTQNTSDSRLKTNIQPITNALLKVCSLNGFTHNWNDLAFELNHFNKEVREVGVFAQEVQAVLPEAVFIAPFDQEKGSPSVSASGKNYLTVQYEKLTPLLIEAIKELKAEFDAYKQTHP